MTQITQEAPGFQDGYDYESEPQSSAEAEISQGAITQLISWRATETAPFATDPGLPLEFDGQGNLKTDTSKPNFNGQVPFGD